MCTVHKKKQEQTVYKTAIDRETDKRGGTGENKKLPLILKEVMIHIKYLLLYRNFLYQKLYSFH